MIPGVTISSEAAASIQSGSCGAGTAGGHAFARVLADRRSEASRDGAKAFGEDGLFQPAAPWLADYGVAATPSPKTAAPAAPGGRSNDPTVGPPSEPASVPDRLVASPQRVTEAPEATIRLLPLLVSAAAATAHPDRSFTLALTTDRPRASQMPAGPSRFRNPAAASLPVRLAVENDGAGMVVRIMVARPDVEDARDLVERVADLLARHGHVGTRIVLNGAVAAPRSLEQDQHSWR